jgi:hypothetical protein
MLTPRVLVGDAMRLTRNVLFDLRYGGFLGGSHTSPYAALGIYNTVNTDYTALRLIFEERIKDCDVLVDIGCGKGRVINWWLSHYRSNRIIGLEIDKEIARRTQIRLRRWKNVSIVAGDAVENLPRDGTIFYLYNPCSEPWMVAIRDRLRFLFSERKSVTVFYYNCDHIDAFRSDPDWLVEEVDLGGSQHIHRNLAIVKLRP